MSAKQSSPDRREVLAASAAVAASSLIPTQTHAETTNDAIRQFNIDVPEVDLTGMATKATSQSTANRSSPDKRFLMT